MEWSAHGEDSSELYICPTLSCQERDKFLISINLSSPKSKVLCCTVILSFQLASGQIISCRPTIMAERTSDVEKHGLDDDTQVEDAVLALANDERVNTFTPEEQRSIIWRIDRRLVLTLGFLYMISLMDRTNLGAASGTLPAHKLCYLSHWFIRTISAPFSRNRKC
jgi:hypothetical protein